MCIVPNDGQFLHNQRLGKVEEINTDLVTRGFLYWIFNYEGYRQQIRGSATGATVRHTSPDRVYSCKISLPPLSVQKKIAGILSAYDDLIQNNLKRIKLLEELAQITYEEWFVRLSFPGYENMQIDPKTMLPEGWDPLPLSRAISVNPKTKIPKGLAHPFIPMQSVNESSMVIQPVEYRTASGGAKFKDGDTLVARITPCLENGKTGFVTLPNDNNVGTGSTEFIVLRETDRVNRYYIYCLARSNYFRGNSINAMLGTDGRQRVNTKIYDRLIVNVPNRHLMDAFRAKVKPCFDAVTVLSRQNELLKEARDILLPRLMTGIIDPEEYHPEKVLEEAAV